LDDDDLESSTVMQGVDELALFVWPVILGGRNPALPTETRADLELIDEHRFTSGVVYLRYRVQ
jgi:riboflavin biosynthesis pyrimidine reductase